MADEISMHRMQFAQTITERSSTDTEENTLDSATGDAPKSIERAGSKYTLDTGNGPAVPTLPRSVVFKRITGACAMLLVLFWANTSWIFGKIYKQADYSHRLHVLSVDLDGGAIGKMLLDTTSLLSGSKGEPTYELITYSGNDTFDSIYDRVRAGGNVWGAIIANPNASGNLANALSSSSNVSYNADSALMLLYNEARFHTIEISLIYSTMMGAASVTTANYQRTHGIETISNLRADATDENRAAALRPIGYTVVNINPFGFSSSVLLNTVMFVFPILSQFFAVLAVNGILGSVGAYATWSLKSHLIFRAILGTVFPCVVGLSWAGWVFVWKDGGHLGVGQFFLAWLSIWLYAAINFHVIDGTCSLVEMRWMPFFMITAIITQVSAALSPMELASNFYRIEYLLPSHHIWGILMTIFGNGAANDLTVNLTVALLMLPVAATYNLFGNYTRWKKANTAVTGISSPAH